MRRRQYRGMVFTPLTNGYKIKVDKWTKECKTIREVFNFIYLMAPNIDMYRDFRDLLVDDYAKDVEEAASRQIQ